jgi:hypothetical protein
MLLVGPHEVSLRVTTTILIQRHCILEMTLRQKISIFETGFSASAPGINRCAGNLLSISVLALCCCKGLRFTRWKASRFIGPKKKQTFG